ncbi:helix-turn-helix domain-containing protein [Halorussus gelatinilyticus]|uniref:Helix-turn-helix domain-containing protein n=1 Tax=Halorussus gelatinilyticus TaxID=2937524 RepID=A0A8U0IFM1_9EURY|nr:bacterio-opsin activator domain-containing protein [Halorussus gelatinilyticus]UPV99011.1 helix-turn-helix domain-containing protein [Halorussus gelatinilyticus]
MGIVTEFAVPADDFLLAWTLDALPDVHVEIERVAVEDDAVTPFFWASGVDFEAFEAALEDDSSVADPSTVETHEDQRLYQVEWRRNTEGIVYAISESGATVLQATSDGGVWTVETLFPDSEDLASFQDYAAAHDLSFELKRLSKSAHPEALGKYGVTDEQYDALVAAYRLGYFEVPSETDLRGVADGLDISKNAASARLQRGYANLVENTLIHDE